MSSVVHVGEQLNFLDNKIPFGVHARVHGS